ncbi:MAG: polyprenyl diphosphate synthase [Fluviibacter sp.]
MAIIMDGNGRWAKRRLLPRVAGHRQGVETVRSTVRRCLEMGVEHLTLFAFSSENWRRPPEEVTLLMQLFMRALEQEVGKLNEHGIRLRVVGDRSRFAPELQTMIAQAESITASNTRMTLHVCANYGGRWDIAQAINRLVLAQPERAGEFVEQDLEPYLCFAGVPEPDLFIRTGGEERISNFLLWQLAYSELYFTPILWPEFGEEAFVTAIRSFQKRQRRFGQTGDQIEAAQRAAIQSPGTAAKEGNSSC